MKINNQKIVSRWDNVMCSITHEHLTINTELSELEENKKYYGLEKGVSTEWMIERSKYLLSCYYEIGNSVCDDRFESRKCYKTWLSETGKLKRLIAALEKMENELIVEW